MASTEATLRLSGDRVGGEQDAGRLRRDHPLYDDGHLHRSMIEAVAQAVGHGALGEERRPAPTDSPEDRRSPDDVEVRVVLSCEGDVRQILRRRAGSDGVRGVLAEALERLRNRRRDLVRDGDRFDDPADFRADRADRVAVVELQSRQVDRSHATTARRHDSFEGVGRHAESGWYVDAFDPRQLSQVRAFTADDRDLRLVDVVEVQHVAVHPVTPSLATTGTLQRGPGLPASPGVVYILNVGGGEALVGRPLNGEAPFMKRCRVRREV